MEAVCDKEFISLAPLSVSIITILSRSIKMKNMDFILRYFGLLINMTKDVMVYCSCLQFCLFIHIFCCQAAVSFINIYDAVDGSCSAENVSSMYFKDPALVIKAARNLFHVLIIAIFFLYTGNGLEFNQLHACLEISISFQ